MKICGLELLCCVTEACFFSGITPLGITHGRERAIADFAFPSMKITQKDNFIAIAVKLKVVEACAEMSDFLKV